MDHDEIDVVRANKIVDRVGRSDPRHFRLSIEEGHKTGAPQRRRIDDERSGCGHRLDPATGVGPAVHASTNRSTAAEMATATAS